MITKKSTFETKKQKTKKKANHEHANILIDFLIDTIFMKVILYMLNSMIEYFFFLLHIIRQNMCRISSFFNKTITEQSSYLKYKLYLI